MVKLIITKPFKSNIDDSYLYVYRIDYDNGDYYLGYHKTNNLNDDYKGSNFRKSEGSIISRTIISFHKDFTDVANAEKVIVGDLWKSDVRCLNQVPGGIIGGWQNLPKEVVDEWRRETLEKIKTKEFQTEMGHRGAKAAHKEKTPEGKSKMTAECNKKRGGKKKIRKDWDKVTNSDKNMFPRLYKRIEGDYEFASAMCLPEMFDDLLESGWYPYVSKTKGKKVHSDESKQKISKSIKRKKTNE